MQLRLIRNATLRLEYAGRAILVDPYLAPRHSRPSFAGRSANPLVGLPVPPAAVLAGVELAIVSHLHSDHFDPLAQELLPKDLPLVCQPGDEAAIRGLGFADVTPLADRLGWGGVTLDRVEGRHGSGAVLAEMGPAMGFVLRAAGEPTLYWAGDTVLCPSVLGAIDRFRPEVVVVHACGAVWGEGTPIVTDAAQAVAVCEAAPAATVVATHMDALDHATVSRAGLRAAARAAGIDDGRLLIPLDGEALVVGGIAPPCRGGVDAGGRAAPFGRRGWRRRPPRRCRTPLPGRPRVPKPSPRGRPPAPPPRARPDRPRAGPAVGMAPPHRRRLTSRSPQPSARGRAPRRSRRCGPTAGRWRRAASSPHCARWRSRDPPGGGDRRGERRRSADAARLPPVLCPRSVPAC